jgi:hypothetical protein
VLYAKLRLRINEAKSAVALAWDRKFLGYSFGIVARMERSTTASRPRPLKS